MDWFVMAHARFVMAHARMDGPHGWDEYDHDETRDEKFGYQC